MLMLQDAYAVHEVPAWPQHRPSLETQYACTSVVGFGKSRLEIKQTIRPRLRIKQTIVATRREFCEFCESATLNFRLLNVRYI